MKDRRSFLKEVCPTVAFAFFGLSFLEACSSDSIEETNATKPTGPIDSGSDNGFTQSGSTLTIDLTHPNFSSLSNVGDWMNGNSIGISMLFLRTSSSNIQAYTNVCPHEGTQNQWIKSGNNFRCENHGRSYSTEDCSPSAELTCYSTSINGDTLEVST